MKDIKLSTLEFLIIVMIGTFLLIRFVDMLQMNYEFRHARNVEIIEV